MPKQFTTTGNLLNDKPLKKISIEMLDGFVLSHTFERAKRMASGQG
jgi:hypothetical protein